MEWYEITLLILLVIAFISFLIFLGVKSNQNKEKDNERKRQEAGKEGEEIINLLLKELADKYNAKYFSNVNLKINEKNFEIDHIFISTGGFYVIETKNLSGSVFYDNDENEFYRIKNGQYESIGNPISQNEGHIRKLKKLFGVNPPKMKNVVVFVSTDISNINHNFVYNEITLEEYLVREINTNKKTHNYITNMENRVKELIQNNKV